MQTNNHGDPAPIHFLIDPSIAKSVLSKHELVAPAAVAKNISNANLHKPTKPTKFLQHALTSANGTAWTRQRHCVARAFAVDRHLRASCASHAVDTMMHHIDMMILDLQCNKEKGKENENENEKRWKWKLACPSWTNKLKLKERMYKRKKKRRGMDVRCLAREVAISTMARMVLGNSSKHGSNINIIDLLRDTVDDTLQPKRDVDVRTMNADADADADALDLDAAVRKCMHEIADEIADECKALAARASDTGSNLGSNHSGSESDSEENAHQYRKRDENDCLARRLLFYEHKNEDTHTGTNMSNEYYLTRDEVVGNAHSALRAGIQTICKCVFHLSILI